MRKRSLALVLPLVAFALPTLADPPVSGEPASLAVLPARHPVAVPLASRRLPGPPAAVPVGGWFVGASLGASLSSERGGDLDDALQRKVAFSTNTDLETDHFAWKLYGGYRFPETPWSIELGYTDLGSFDSVIRAAPPDIPAFISTIQDQYPLIGHGPTLAAQYHFLERSDFGLTAKLGAWWWDAEGTFDLSIPPGGTGPATAVDQSGLDPLIGIGGHVGLSPEVSARAEIEAYWLDGDEVYLFSVGVVYAIGGGSGGSVN